MERMESDLRIEFIRSSLPEPEREMGREAGREALRDMFLDALVDKLREGRCEKLAEAFRDIRLELL